MFGLRKMFNGVVQFGPEFLKLVRASRLATASQHLAQRLSGLSERLDRGGVRQPHSHHEATL